MVVCGVGPFHIQILFESNYISEIFAYLEQTLSLNVKCLSWMCHLLDESQVVILSYLTNNLFHK